MEQQNIPPTPVNTDMQVSPNNNKKIIIIGIILLLLVGSGSYFLGSKSQQNKQKAMVEVTPTTEMIAESTSTLVPSQIPNISPVPTKHLVINPMANWKTFSNKYFAFKYPSDYFRYESRYIEQSVYIAPSEGNGEAKGSPLGLNPQTDVWIDVNVLTNTTETLEGFMNLKENGEMYTNVPKEPILIAGQKGYKLLLSHPTGPESVYTDIGIMKEGNDIYRITLNAFNKEVLSNKETLFNQVLSTFTISN